MTGKPVVILAVGGHARILPKLLQAFRRPIADLTVTRLLANEQRTLGR